MVKTILTCESHFRKLIATCLRGSHRARTHKTQKQSLSYMSDIYSKICMLNSIQGHTRVQQSCLLGNDMSHVY